MEQELTLEAVMGILRKPITNPAIPLGIYRHYKGGLYVVTRTSTHTETGEVMVEYRGLTGEWTRPFSMFTEEVETEAGRVPRFRLLVEVPFSCLPF